MISFFAAAFFLAANLDPDAAFAATPSAIDHANVDGIVVFHDIPFKHPVTLLLRTVDLETGAFGDVNLLVTSGGFAAGRGMLKAGVGAQTVKQFHAATLAPGSYAMIGKIERIPAGDTTKKWTTCFPKGAEIFTLEGAGRLLVKAPTNMTFDPAEMERQIQQYLKADDAQLEKDFAAILEANPAFGGDYKASAPSRAISFKLAKSRGVETDECLRAGPAKGKIIPYTAPGAR